MKYKVNNLEDIAKMFDANAADEHRKMNSLAVSQKAKLDYKARMQTWTTAAEILRQTELIEKDKLKGYEPPIFF